MFAMDGVIRSAAWSLHVLHAGHAVHPIYLGDWKHAGTELQTERVRCGGHETRRNQRADDDRYQQNADDRKVPTPFGRLIVHRN